MPDSTPPPSVKIEEPGREPGVAKRPVVIPPEARVTRRMSQEILGALQERGVEPIVHRERVAQLRTRVKTLAPALGRTVRALSREQFHERFALVNLMRELDDEAALPELVSLVEAPAVRGAPSALSVLETQRDTMIRTLAVEGVARLAHRGSSSARAALERQLHHVTFSVRRAAVQGLLAAGGPDAADKIRAALDPKEHFLLEVKVRDPREIMRSLRPTLPAVSGRPPKPPLPGPKMTLASMRLAPQSELTEEDAPSQPDRPKEERAVTSDAAISITQDELRGEQYILDCWSLSPDMVAEMTWLAQSYGAWEAADTWANAGWNDCLNPELPFAQTMMGMWLLTHASDDLSTYLESARLSAMSLLTDTRWSPNSGGPNAIATTRNASWVDLHDSFRYESVINRAATLWHEAIHMYGDPHDAFFPAWSDLYQTDLDNGQADEYFGIGAYSASTAYLIDYIANATRVTPLLRALARERANWELDNCFAQHPGFSVGMPTSLVGDFDANNFTDFAVYRPATGHWHIRPNNAIAASDIDLDWGQPTDLPVPGCYSTNRVLDYGLYRPSTGYWRIKSGVNGATEAIQWGAPEDTPVPGDFNGDGFTELAVWRPSTGYLYNKNGNHIDLGRAGDIPAPGRFYHGSDGEPPRLCFALFRPTSTCHWRIWRPLSSDPATFVWGQAGDIPVPGDYDGDGQDEYAIWRPSDGSWCFHSPATGAEWWVKFGRSGDIPVPGYYYDSGDKRLQIAVWRPSNGKWYIHIWDTDQMYVQQWGQAGDIPIPGVTGWLFYRRLMQDIDGDGRTDPGIFRPSSQRWAVYNLATHKSEPRRDWPVATGEIIVPADYNGDGRMEYATWRPSDGMWRWYDDLEGQEMSSQWGQAGDIPVPADYDGDGCAELAVYRPSDGMWYRKNIRSGTECSDKWGKSTDIPTPADFDGDGRAELAFFRPADTGTKFRIKNTLTGDTHTITMGAKGDIPVPADYDGDGRAEAAIWKPDSGRWWFKKLNAGSATGGQQWGKEGDIPVPGDYDGDGRIDIAVWRPSNGNWYIIYSSSGESKIFKYGQEGDIPITATPWQKAC